MKKRLLRVKSSRKKEETMFVFVFSFIVILLLILIFIFGGNQFFASFGLGQVVKNQDLDGISLKVEPTEYLLTVPNEDLIRQNIASLKNTNIEIISTLKLYNKEEAKSKKVIAKNLEKLALSRKKLLIEVMRSNPDAAVSYILPNSDRATLNMICNDCVENISTIEGTLEILHADFFDKGVSINIYTLITKDNRKINLHPAFGIDKGLISGTKLKIKGFKVDNDLIFNGTSSLSSPNQYFGGVEVQALANPEVLGDQKTLVVMVNFRNTIQPQYTVTNAEAWIKSNDKYYKENSYNKIFLSGAINPDKSADVFGWYTLPIDFTCSLNTIRTYTVNAVDPFVNFMEYSRLIIIAPLTGCGAWGFATLGKTYVSTADGLALLSTSWILVRDGLTNRVINGTIGHELGHNFGNHHATFYDCGDTSISEFGCTIKEYGDAYDILGDAFHFGHFNAIHKENVGWFSGANIQEVPANGIYNIEPIETATAGLKSIKIKRSAIDYLYVEYRRPIGFDWDLVSADVFNGALIHITRSDLSRSYLIDPTPLPTPPTDEYTIALLSGKTLIDPLTNSRITTVDSTPSLLTVDVTLGKTDFDPPEITINSPAFGSTVSGVVTIDVSATDPSGIELVAFEFWDWNPLGRINVIFLGADTAPPYQMALDTNLYSDYKKEIVVRAYDLAGSLCWQCNNMAVSQPHEINAQNPPRVEIINPLDGTSVSGTNVEISATASDNVGVQRVEFYYDNNILLGTNTISPYAITFDSTVANNGEHKIFAKAYDLVGNEATSNIRTIYVSNRVGGRGGSGSGKVL